MAIRKNPDGSITVGIFPSGKPGIVKPEPLSEKQAEEKKPERKPTTKKK